MALTGMGNQDENHVRRDIYVVAVVVAAAAATKGSIHLEVEDSIDH